MRTALILGMTGSFGAEMAKALQAKGWSIKAIVRSPEKLTLKQRAYQIIEGDFQDKSTLLKATDGVELIVYGINPPYEQWQAKSLPMLASVLLIAEQKRLHIVFPGNVYSLKPSLVDIDESVKAEPITALGEIREQMEVRLHKASKRGARVTIVRSTDYISEYSQWLNILLKKKAKHYIMSFPHTTARPHYWCYLPDLCANTVKLIERSSQPFEVWHFQGIAITQADWQQAFKENGQLLKTKAFPWWLIHGAALFSPMLSEVIKMKYLWQQRLTLDDTKMRNVLGHDFQETCLHVIVKEIISKASR